MELHDDFFFPSMVAPSAPFVPLDQHASFLEALEAVKTTLICHIKVEVQELSNTEDYHLQEISNDVKVVIATADAWTRLKSKAGSGYACSIAKHTKYKAWNS